MLSFSTACKAPLSTWWRDERKAAQPSAALVLAAGCWAAQAGQPTRSQAQNSCTQALTCSCSTELLLHCGAGHLRLTHTEQTSCTQALTCSCSTELLFSVVGSCHLRLRCAMLRKESRSKGCSPEASAKRAGTCLGQGGGQAGGVQWIL